MTAYGLGPRSFPSESAGACVKRRYERVFALVANEEDPAAGKHRRHTHAVQIVERPQRSAPQLATRMSVSQKSEIREKDDNLVAVGRRGRRSRAVAFIQMLSPMTRR